jgi:FecR-like protein
MSPGFPRRIVRLPIFISLLFLPATASLARGGRGAQITQVKGDVRISLGDSTPVTAANDLNIEEGSTIQTVSDGWVELRFNNLGVARLGPNSVFSFKDGSRRLTLKEGSVVVQMPKGAHGARIEADGNVAVVAGTTALLECHQTVYKFLVLEGTARFFRPGHFGDSILIPPGRMVIGQPGTALSDPVDFDIGRFLKTSRFLTDFRPLESASQMERQAARQDRDKARGILRSTNLAIFGGGTSVSVLDPSKSPSPGESTTTASPPPQQTRDIAPPPVDRIPSGR